MIPVPGYTEKDRGCTVEQLPCTLKKGMGSGYKRCLMRLVHAELSRRAQAPKSERCRQTPLRHAGDPCAQRKKRGYWLKIPEVCLSRRRVLVCPGAFGLLAGSFVLLSCSFPAPLLWVGQVERFLEVFVESRSG